MLYNYWYCANCGRIIDLYKITSATQTAYIILKRGRTLIFGGEYFETFYVTCFSQKCS